MNQKCVAKIRNDLSLMIAPVRFISMVRHGFIQESINFGQRSQVQFSVRTDTGMKPGVDTYEIAIYKKHKKFARYLRSTVNPKYYRSWIQVFPLAGLFQTDFYAANFSDFNKRKLSFPHAIEAWAFKKGIAEMKVSKWLEQIKILKKLFKYRKNDNQYHLIHKASEKDKAKIIGVFLGFITSGVKIKIPKDWREYILDFNGGNKTYDGHGGIDYFVVDYERQTRGVPVVAVADGIVHTAKVRVLSRDGLPLDDSYISIYHGYQRYSYYHHIYEKLLVKKGEQVRAGQQIGWARAHTKHIAGHLHFGITEWGKFLEPHSGSVNKIPSRFKKQPQYFKEPPRVIFYAFRKAKEYKRLGYYPIGKKDVKLWIRITNYKKI